METVGPQTRGVDPHQDVRLRQQPGRVQGQGGPGLPVGAVRMVGAGPGRGLHLHLQTRLDQAPAGVRIQRHPKFLGVDLLEDGDFHVTSPPFAHGLRGGHPRLKVPGGYRSMTQGTVTAMKITI